MSWACPLGSEPGVALQSFPARKRDKDFHFTPLTRAFCFIVIFFVMLTKGSICKLFVILSAVGWFHPTAEYKSTLFELFVFGISNKVTLEC